MPVADVLDLHPPVADLRADVIAGLSNSPKSLPPKWLYDEAGSELFDRICETEDYYPTRTERRIFEQHGEAIAEALGPGVTLIEPGAGSGEKAERLLGMLDSPASFVPIEISRSALEASAERASGSLPGVRVQPICADFTAQRLGQDEIEGLDRRVVFCPGGTIGNFEPDHASEVLARFAELAGAGGLLLIGIDLMKPVEILEAAYDDSEGVTAAFNLNILTRMNRELGADFDREGFRHEARVNTSLNRVEMHLVARAEQTAEIGGEVFRVDAGESIHTESSHKFEPEAFAASAAQVGLSHVHTWTDDRAWFALQLYSAQPA